MVYHKFITFWWVAKMNNVRVKLQLKTLKNENLGWTSGGIICNGYVLTYAGNFLRHLKLLTTQSVPDYEILKKVNVSALSGEETQCSMKTGNILFMINWDILISFFKHCGIDWRFCTTYACLSAPDTELNASCEGSFFLIKLGTIDESDVRGEIHRGLELFCNAVEASIFARGSCIYTITCPFGDIDLMNSRFDGVISNLHETHRSILTLDMFLPPFSEGSPVYIKSVEGNDPCIGMLIGTIFTGNNTTGLPVAVSISDLLSGTLRWFSNEAQINVSLKSSISRSVISQRNVTESCVAYIETRGQRRTCGSCVVVSKCGWIISSAHIFKDEDADCEIVVRIHGVGYLAELKFTDSRNDFSILKIEPGKELVMANISQQEVIQGEPIIAIGYALRYFSQNQTPCVTVGNVAKVWDSIFLTSSRVFRGDSGGGIFNSNGELVGMILSNVVYKADDTHYPFLNISLCAKKILSLLLSYCDDELRTDCLRSALPLIE